MGADHARYVYSGMSLLDGRGYVNESGETYLLRAPAYPLMLGGAFDLAGTTGAHLVAWGLGLVGLLLAIVIAGRLGGSVAVFATAAAVVAVAQFWEQLVSLGIDLPQAAMYLAAILLLWQPRPAYWLAAGGLLGVAVLVKETIAPAVVLLPMAWLPAWSGLPWRRWAWLGFLFLLAVAVVAGWWWLLVWRETGLLFPLNSLQAIVPDEAALSVSVTPAILLAGLGAAAAWAYLLVRRFRDPGVRLLVAAAVALAPAVAATLALAQPARNLTAVVLLSCVAAGVALADLVQALSPRLAGTARSMLAGGVALVLVAVAVIGQLSVAPAVADPLPADIATVLRKGLEPGREVVSTFRYRSALGVELFDEDVSIRLVPVRAVERAADPSRYLWLGERRGTLFGLTRDNWQRVLGSPRAAYLVLIAPHALTPAELVPTLRAGAAEDAGLTFVRRLRAPTGTADVFAITPDRIDRAPQIRLHAQPAALVHWLDIAEAAGGAGAADPAEALIASQPVVPARGKDLDVLATRLGAAACFRPGQEGDRDVLTIVGAAGQTDCVGSAALEGTWPATSGERPVRYYPSVAFIRHVPT